MFLLFKTFKKPVFVSVYSNNAADSAQSANTYAAVHHRWCSSAEDRYDIRQWEIQGLAKRHAASRLHFSAVHDSMATSQTYHNMHEVLHYLTFRASRLLLLPSAEAISVQPNAW